jgi:acetolactate synthase-1/2/3 large subunit
MNIANFLISICEEIGISQAFSLVGGMAMHINNAAGSGNLSMIYCNHEQAVVAAADGYTKAADFAVPGLAIVTSGPGVTNSVTSISSAYYDSVPLFLLSGQIKTSDINRFDVRSYGAQEVPHTELLRSITKLSFSYDPAIISNADLALNLALAMTGRKGPVHIDIPLDIQTLEVKGLTDVKEVVSDYRKQLYQDANQTCVLPSELITQIAVAQRPLLVLGNAVKISSIPKEVTEVLIQHLGFPVMLTWASMDLLDYEHPMVFGCAGGLAGVHSNRILQSADLIIFLGTRLDLLTTGFNPASYGKNAKRFVFECDEAELKKNSSVVGLMGIKADVRAAVRALIATKSPDHHSCAPWVEQCTSWRLENQEAEDKEFFSPRLNTFHIANLISSSRTTRYVVPTASGFAIEGFARFYKTTKGSRFAWAGHVLGSMGLAIPSAVGASARLKYCVACVDGDGGFLLNMQELYTLRANPDLPIAIFILNNRGYASISQSQNRAFQRNFGANAESGLAEIDFKIIASLGDLKYVECKTYISLKEIITELNSNSRILINVFLDDDNYRGPSITTKFDAEGRPYSTDIGEVSWR